MTAGFGEFSLEAKCLVCRAGEECQRECSLLRCTPAVLEIERVVSGGWLLCWHVSVTVSREVLYTERSAWIELIYYSTGYQSSWISSLDAGGSKNSGASWIDFGKEASCFSLDEASVFGVACYLEDWPISCMA